jgi:hypothetical protein
MKYLIRSPFHLQASAINCTTDTCNKSQASKQKVNNVSNLNQEPYYTDNKQKEAFTGKAHLKIP